ncbi:hypothetical protein GJ744_009864 [Endocarpon pusillum]|uniref:Uncharacterized protein n=1 Tax=Endocarpon pusillum TaxID=364733 RepID=A0A8H7AJ74_9EURO|nr:hypothetical protein GJ744_009864 [Endocarpon pusillum]
MKHMDGPCGACPYNYSASLATLMKPTLVAFEGSCLPCDTELRRGKELEHIEAYQEAYQAELNAFKHHTGRETTGDEQKRTRTKHRNTRDSRIKQVWGNWIQRWKSPMVIDFGEDGKAILKKSAV